MSCCSLVSTCYHCSPGDFRFDLIILSKIFSRTSFSCANNNFNDIKIHWTATERNLSATWCVALLSNILLCYPSETLSFLSNRHGCQRRWFVRNLCQCCLLWVLLKKDETIRRRCAKFVHLCCKITYSQKSIFSLHLHYSQTEALASCRHVRGNLEVVGSGNTNRAVLATRRLSLIWDAEEASAHPELSPFLSWLLSLPELCLCLHELCHAWLEWKFSGFIVLAFTILSGLEHDGSNWVVFSSPFNI